LALAARSEGVSRDAYDRAVDAGDLVVAHVIRGAIHALAPGDLALYGRALLARDEEELGVPLGRQVQRLAAEKGFAPSEALGEVAKATQDALANGRVLDKNGLHEELRGRVRNELLPWCRGCGSHHVAPMLWRYALVRVGARRDSEHRYVAGEPVDASGAEVARRLLRFYGPSDLEELEGWAQLARSHARRLWQEIEDELVEVNGGYLLASDEGAFESPPPAEGLRLLPPGDPFLQRPNRATLVPDAELRKRVFRPTASPGVVLQDGELGGLWRARGRGAVLELEVERLGRLDVEALEAEAARVAALRGAHEPRLSVA
jgi:hypothetical protein